MKTSLLQQLSKEITQGEWKAFGCAIYTNSSEQFGGDVKVASSFIDETGDRMPSDQEILNAGAIALTPRLIREVLELRECLATLDKASTNYFYGDNRVAPVGTTTHSDYCDAKRKVKSLLTRHETTN